ncbi:MAG: bifunctional 4-hydroxy-3-methylbut-2-enyl diphosphate reductase/30S ribosomal protein S1 [Clostridiales bacterium]|nr:bifunctional 4-hydroxy-3-methylbut-2-enyl diphosphate reductase/30S ribosomal protein S1 [Clostridiales bacterium]
MNVLQAKSAGFCYGVRRAVELAEQTVEAGTPCVMLGPIIHNAHVVEAFARRGMGCVSSVEEVPEGCAVLIRSHGESRAVYQALAERGVPVVDATCPNVSRIHNLVSEAEEKGRIPVIIGKKSHPEVLATAGWCRGAIVLETAEELEKWLKEGENRCDLPLTLVCQTTASKENWKKSVEIAKKLCTNAEIFDTMCNATYHRQAEAVSLAKQCDAMIVIGDHASSNTRHLAELCEAECDNVIWIEQAADLPEHLLNGAACVGITAGASTPGWIIKEVKNKMSEETMEIEESFKEMLEKSIKTLNTGDKVTCTVVNITPTELQVELGTKHTGYISETEFSDDPSVKMADAVKIGDQLECVVQRVNDQDGIVTLSKKKLDANRNWEMIEEAEANKTVVEGYIKEQNKGGVVANVKGIRVFIPASQTGLRRNEPMDSLVGTTARMHITEVNRGRRRVVGSIRSVAAEERAAKAQAIWDNIEVDKHYTGTVKSLTSYGAFVDIGGVDGMVHISELSWSRIKHPSEVVSVGDTLDVYVIKYDPERKKISLGVKDRTISPWQNFMDTCKVGDIVTVKIVKLMSFGAFAEIVPGVDGLIHISQIADHRVEKPEDELAEGQTVEVKITDINEETKKVSLSRRAALRDAEDEYDDED